MISTRKEHSDRSHKSDIETAPGTEKKRLLWIVFVLRSGLFLAELVTGLWTHSLSLLAVSGHMLVDVLTIGVALIATWLAERSFKDKTPFGQERVEAWEISRILPESRNVKQGGVLRKEIKGIKTR